MARELIFNLYGIEAREGEGEEVRLELEAVEVWIDLTPEEAAILGAHLQGWAVRHGVICSTNLVSIVDGTEEAS